MISFFVRLFFQYGIKFILILLYEIYYISLGYKGNTLNILKNKFFSDNIPIPFFFLKKITLYIDLNKIKYVYDLGCGSGRFIYFLSRKNKKLKIFGLENKKKIFNKTYSIFKKNKNIKILRKNILNYSNYKNTKSPVIYFLNDPLRKEKDYNLLFKKIKQKIKKKDYLITVNINYNLKILKKFKIIFYYNIKKKKNIKIYKTIH